MTDSTRGASPSSRHDELYYYGIIEGALHSRGEEAYSVKVWHALRMLGKLLGAPMITPEDQVVPAKVEKAITAMKETARTVEDSDGESPGNRWLPWQINLLREMKAAGESAPSIAAAVEKTVTQVHNKWFQIKNKPAADDDGVGEAA